MRTSRGLNMLALTLAIMLVGTPVGMGRKLLDMQDLHPEEPGALPDASIVAASDEAFQADLQSAETTMAIENDAPISTVAGGLPAEVAESAAAEVGTFLLGLKHRS